MSETNTEILYIDVGDILWKMFNQTEVATKEEIINKFFPKHLKNSERK